MVLPIFILSEQYNFTQFTSDDPLRFNKKLL